MPPALPHPIVQHIPPMDFAVSCSIDPGHSRGRPVIANTGLWSMGPEYHHENFHPVPQHCPEMRYGAFVQAWAARHGQGRAVAFTDSTIFSNFCVFQPGKAELMLGMVEWLNHANPPLDPRPWLLLLGLPPLAAGLWMALVAGGHSLGRKLGRQLHDALRSASNGHSATTGAWLVLLAAGACGWVAASLAVDCGSPLGHAHARMRPSPTLRRHRPHHLDRAALQGRCTPRATAKATGCWKQWIARLGCYTVRKEGPEAFSGDALVVICPSRSVTEEFREQLTQYVDQRRQAAGDRLAGERRLDGQQPALAVWAVDPSRSRVEGQAEHDGRSCRSSMSPAANEVTGGQPVGKLDKLPVAATAKHGKGSVMAVGFGSLWNDTRMGEHWMLEPDATVKARYDVLFALLRSLLDDKPLPAAMPPTPEKGPQEMGPADTGPQEKPPAVLKESGPAEL